MRSKQTYIALKRAYEAASASDGTRILVERLWPRGLTKERAAIDHWIKEAAPSSQLRQWYGHQPERWPAFQERYREELKANPAAVEALRQYCAAGPVTFVFAARDTARNGSVVLKSYLEDLVETAAPGLP